MFSHLRTDSPITIQLMGDQKSFVQEVPRDLQCFHMILATCVVEDVSRHLNIPFQDFLSDLGAPFNFT